MNRGEQDISKAKGIVIRKLPALKNEVMWANIYSFYGNLSSSVIYGQWPSRSILDNMKVFLA